MQKVFMGDCEAFDRICYIFLVAGQLLYSTEHLWRFLFAKLYCVLSTKYTFNHSLFRKITVAQWWRWSMQQTTDPVGHLAVAWSRMMKTQNNHRDAQRHRADEHHKQKIQAYNSQRHFLRNTQHSRSSSGRPHRRWVTMISFNSTLTFQLPGGEILAYETECFHKTAVLYKLV